MIAGLMVLAWVAGVALFFIAESTGIYALDLLTALIMTPLGLPWNLTPIFTGGPDALRMVIALGAPVINILLAWMLCKVLTRRFCPQGC
jgi:hypothetical protein